MKKTSIALICGLFLGLASCEKDNPTPAAPEGKNQLKECKDCSGGWDITDPDGD